METSMILLLSISAVLGIILFIIGIWETFMYINYSWAKRDNENGYNGMEAANKYLENLGDSDIRVKSAFFRMSYVRYSKMNKTMKLGVFDSKRKSLWTMASVAKQSVAAHVIENGRDEKFDISPFWFRIQSFWSQMFLSFISLFLTSIFITSIIEGWGFIALGTILVISLLMSLPIFAFWKTSKVVYNHCDEILGNIISNDEKERLKKLWKIEYIHATVLLIKTIIDIIINVLMVILISKDR